MTTNELEWIVFFLLMPFILLAIYRIKEHKKQKVRELAAEKIKQDHAFVEKKKKAKKPQVSVTLNLIGGNDYTLEIKNTGGTLLKNVEMELLLEDHQESPLIKQEYEKIFPVAQLAVGQTVSLHAVQHAGCPQTYNVRVRWAVSGGDRLEDQFYVHA